MKKKEDREWLILIGRKKIESGDTVCIMVNKNNRQLALLDGFF